MRVAIIGAGVGGLASAIALRQIGADASLARFRCPTNLSMSFAFIEKLWHSRRYRRPTIPHLSLEPWTAAD